MVASVTASWLTNTDITNKEQFTICLGWVDEKLNDHEDFIGLYQVDSIDANSGTSNQTP